MRLFCVVVLGLIVFVELCVVLVGGDVILVFLLMDVVVVRFF